ncbi:MAG: NAD(P)-binding protein [Candidatus Marinamargulisbacteria bacterium]
MINTTSIAIIGAGIGGLVTAIALRKKGFNPIVYDRLSGPTPTGAGLVLSIKDLCITKKRAKIF